VDIGDNEAGVECRHPAPRILATDVSCKRAAQARIQMLFAPIHLSSDAIHAGLDHKHCAEIENVFVSTTNEIWKVLLPSVAISL
jgi:hypothetical protein